MDYKCGHWKLRGIVTTKCLRDYLGQQHLQVLIIIIKYELCLLAEIITKKIRGQRGAAFKSLMTSSAIESVHFSAHLART